MLASMVTDVSVVGIIIGRLEAGLDLRVVCDACASGSQIADAMAWRLMQPASMPVTWRFAMNARPAS